MTLSARSDYKRDFVTSSGTFGLHTYHPEINRTVLEGGAAGMNKVETAYYEMGHLFPRFERQKVRLYMDDNILTGVKKPTRNILQSIPCKLRPPPPDGQMSGRGNASARSVSTRSAGTSRSAHSDMLLDNKYSARSSQIGMAGLGPEWVNQYRNEPDFLNRNYMTHNSFYGTGCKDDPYRPMRPFEPGRGRELWMHQTRQHVQPNNSMSTNHLHYPMLRSARGWGNRD